MSQDNVKNIIEALLFASDKPLVIDQIKESLGGLDASLVRGVIEDLKSEYETNGRGIRVAEIAGGFQMITSPEAGPFLKKLFKIKRVERLSRQALETLAIVAYKQPVTRLEIESLRSVNADGVMKSLMDKNLIRISGRKKAPGRPFVFGTTRQFLEYFGLKSLDDLPKIEEFSNLQIKGELLEGAAQKTTDNGGDK
ncbi:MAG: SMC-Scp complex subunit ScpB [Candidatus Omnitrophota bacterium]